MCALSPFAVGGRLASGARRSRPFPARSFELDYAALRWAQKLVPGSLPDGRASHSAAIFTLAGQASGLVMWGGSNTQLLQDLWLFEFNSQSWLQLPCAARPKHTGCCCRTAAAAMRRHELQHGVIPIALLQVPLSRGALRPFGGRGLWRAPARLRRLVGARRHEPAAAERHAQYPVQRPLAAHAHHIGRE